MEIKQKYMKWYSQKDMYIWLYVFFLIVEFIFIHYWFFAMLLLIDGKGPKIIGFVILPYIPMLLCLFLYGLTFISFLSNGKIFSYILHWIMFIIYQLSIFIIGIFILH